MATTQAIPVLERAACDSSGQSAIWCNPLQHTRGADLRKRDGDIRDIQDVLRHADIGITQVYTQMAREELRKSCPMAFSSESATRCPTPLATACGAAHTRICASPRASGSRLAEAPPTSARNDSGGKG